MTTPVSDLPLRPSDETLRFLTWLVVEERLRDVALLPDGRWVALRDFLFTVAIVVGQVGDKTEVSDRWCYHSYREARDALEMWDGTGEPEGWHRHPFSGRRRAEDGTIYERP